jgi:hypothetical protein
MPKPTVAFLPIPTTIKGCAQLKRIAHSSSPRLSALRSRSSYGCHRQIRDKAERLMARASASPPARPARTRQTAPGRSTVVESGQGAKPL